MSARSVLYVPADRPDILAKAIQRGAGGLIVDLEDAVAPARKELARDILVDWLAALPADGLLPEIWVRVDPESLGDDVRAATTSRAVTGICLAKTESAAQVTALADMLEQLGSAAMINPLLESAAAIFAAREIASAPRVARLQIGEADLRADTGIVPGPGEIELLWSRSQVVFASAAAGINAPLAPVSTNYRDLPALKESSQALLRLGFSGRACIHPAQLAVIDEVFTPLPEEIDRARAVIASYERNGQGASVGDDGTMIDEAVIRQARRLISRA
jgi:citrate lyase subunit beta/citryl-CoA lyase